MRTVSGRAAIGVVVVTAGLVLAGCGEETSQGDAVSGAGVTISGAEVTVSGAEDGFHGTRLDPAPPRPELVLPTTGGELFDLGDRPADEVTVLFFGYTHCPDLCPTTMADLALARDMLAPEVRDRVQVVFVTEDPARDTPQLLSEWLGRFDPAFTGLIGGTEATATVLTELHLPESAEIADPSTAIVHPHDVEDGNAEEAHEAEEVHEAEEAHEPDGHTHGDYGVDHAGTVYVWGPGGQAVIYTGGTTPGQYAEDLSRLAAAG
ncbi:SCO family protein [Modestobacter sp. KNN46-3]|uniref:SCO family protein n=1 Tax=Modestobacter sp. KNN46-3 TaxID=2711218 RepID=UPI0019D14837|nr:SCO family protein [Modestobacter sp. KNN46-3]